MTRAVLTGATGFLGRHLASYLIALGWDVEIIHRLNPASDQILDRFKQRGISISRFTNHEQVREIVSRSHPDFVFHLATNYIRQHNEREIDNLIEANITFGTHLLEGLSGTSCIVVSTMSYFQFRNNNPSPFSLYSASKQAFLEISNYYHENRGMDIRQVVLYDTFGPGDSRDKIIPHILDSLRRNLPLTMGPAKQQINLLFADDVVSGLVAASQPGNPMFMTLKSPTNTTLGQLVGYIEMISGRKLQKSFNNTSPISDLVNQAAHWPCPLGWQVSRTLQSGLEETYRWHSEMKSVC